ncbi:hypothetical protein A3A67_03715 [Candidatus Peribacteria bacterium RIFCSPLOWO2_01_FULL_51_18]|nr:MAG: hypothetical protein A3A67_03715 [Candidatus Peribacteria bacterium RIFCSPLOWO2_01_FULL_51_18]OGJ68474.1 MAG: hypothetical protein A3J34_02095 [Candidatus Peribacteria bacterium RIFCSPLOWO2_02_FULL_51_10]
MSMSARKEENLDKALGFIDEAVKKGANIVVLPELFSVTYFCRLPADKSAFDFAEPIPGPTTKALSDTAKKNGIVLVGGSVYETAEGKHFNTACVFGSDGKQFDIYRKTHIPHDQGFFEQDYFAPGDTGIIVHDTPFGKICVLICYDQWFPEAARIAALKGAEIIIYPTAIATSPDIPPIDKEIKEDWNLMWRSVQVGHAAANCVYVAAVNRVGTEGNMKFWGGSFIAGPGANLLVLGDDKERILYATCDLKYVKKMQESWRFLKERRPEMYGELTKKKN